MIVTYDRFPSNNPQINGCQIGITRGGAPQIVLVYEQHKLSSCETCATAGSFTSNRCHMCHPSAKPPPFSTLILSRGVRCHGHPMGTDLRPEDAIKRQQQMGRLLVDSHGVGVMAVPRTMWLDENWPGFRSTLWVAEVLVGSCWLLLHVVTA